MGLLAVLKLPFTKAVLNLVLLLGFFYQISNSWQKLQEGQLGTTISYESSSGQTLPDFTFCFLEWPSTSSPSLLDQYKELNGRSGPIQNVAITTGRGLTDPRNAADREVLESHFNQTYESVWSFTFTTLGQSSKLYRCSTFTPFTKAKVTMTPAVSFTYKLEPPSVVNGSSYAFVLIHEQGQMVAPNNPKFGAKVLMVSETGIPEGHVSHYDISATKIETLNREPGWQCDPAGETRAGKCFRNYLDDKMGEQCRLPWRQNSDAADNGTAADTRVCDKMEDTDLFNEIYRDVGRAEVSTPDFLGKVGCLRACNFTEYDLVLVHKGPDPLRVGAGLRMVEFSMSQDLLPVQVEKFNYTGSSFVADLGGFLGLLLGICCENIYDFITERIAWLIGRIGNKRL